jgi:putative endonuclease
VTSDLVKRVYEHKAGVHEGFTKKYGVKQLGYFETFDSIEEAIRFEKKLKRRR